DIAQRVRDRREPAAIARREFAATDLVDRPRKPRRPPEYVGRIQSLLAPHHYIHRLHAEDRDVFDADMIADFDIGAVKRADGQRAVQRELHVAGAGGFHARGRNLFGEIGGGDDYFGKADIVVGEEDDLQAFADGRVVVDDFGDVIDELDDQLGVAIARRRLAGEDFHARHPVALRLVLHRLVQRDGFKDVEQ